MQELSFHFQFWFMVQKEDNQTCYCCLFLFDSWKNTKKEICLLNQWFANYVNIVDNPLLLRL